MKISPLFALCLVVPLLSGCKVTFNFTGGSVDTSLETLSVDQFTNNAEIVIPYLAQEVTQQIQDRFLSQSRLTLTSGAADVQLSGYVSRFTVLPVAVQGDNRAAQNRLTIAVMVKFENNVTPKDSWENTFTGFVDFDASQDFSSVEREKIDEVLEQITQDIFSKSIGKW
ncbi:MAG: LptE family protein [Bacteroidia bacterium]|nr:LptE family protein [Bacteroidia bacterium]